MESSAITIDRFTKRFGASTAVHDLTLEVPRGSVFGLLGQNGAGKSTTIKTLLNLLQPSAGRLSILGLDSVRDAVAVRRRVGYVPEEPFFYRWMTVAELVRFNAAFYPTWDHDLAESLLDTLELPLARRLGHLSRGMQAKAGLVLALSPRPDVLVLDDPTSGLDAVVRREFLEAMIATVQSEGATVFFSTHMLNELERIADRVAILHQGRLLACGPLEEIKRGTVKLRVVYPDVVPDSVPLESLVRMERGTHHLLLTVSGYTPDVAGLLRSCGAESIEVLDLSLEEIFVETARGAAHVQDVQHV
jgi:ABC-2 type transport system ATP-binding protein